jgi:hypothetical protein
VFTDMSWQIVTKPLNFEPALSDDVTELILKLLRCYCVQQLGRNAIHTVAAGFLFYHFSCVRYSSIVKCSFSNNLLMISLCSV